MKRFIAVFDGLNFSENTMSYAIYFSNRCGAHLVGVFLEDISMRSYSMADFNLEEGGTIDQFVHDNDKKDAETRNANIEIFRHACEAGKINYSIQRDVNAAMQDLLYESIYADLLIVSAAETLTRFHERPPTKFIKELLTDVECPVLLVPQKYRPIDCLILLYDGEPSSVHAMRTFSYLFSSLKLIKTTVLTIRKEGEFSNYLETAPVTEFIKQHYPYTKTEVFKGDPEDKIVEYLHHVKIQPLVVLGAYRRGRLSRMFRPSMADQLLQKITVPLFITPSKS